MTRCLLRLREETVEAACLHEVCDAECGSYDGSQLAWEHQFIPIAGSRVVALCVYDAA